MMMTEMMYYNKMIRVSKHGWTPRRRWSTVCVHWRRQILQRRVGALPAKAVKSAESMPSAVTHWQS
jgi:hypothetical protein